jgi:hypothetical protein
MQNDFKRASAVAALALITVLAGCDRKQADTNETVASDSSREGSSMVRVVHADPNVASVDIVADESPAFTGVAFRTVTPYKGVKDNLVQFEVIEAGTPLSDSTKPLAENREMLSDGDRYTIVVLPPEGNDTTNRARLRVLEEPTDPGDATKARLRVVNAAKGIETVDVYTPGTTDPFFDDVDFGTEAGFKDFNAGSSRIVIRRDDNGPVLFTVPERNWEAGRTYTIVLTNKSTSSNQVDALVIEDTPETVQAGDAGAPASAPKDSQRAY